MKIDDHLQRMFWEQEHGFRPYNHEVVAFFARQRIDFIRRYIDLGQIGTALDVGCGAGFLPIISQNVPHTWGLDGSFRMLAGNPIPRERLVLGSATELPFKSEAFDLVYGWEILHHLEDPSRAVREMARTSRRWVLLFEPNRCNPGQLYLALIDPAHRWVLRYSGKFLRELVRRAGLDLVAAGVAGCIFPNKTPAFLLPLLKRLPYRLPLVGISQVVICRKGGA